jgi:ribosomal protein L32
MKNELNKLIKRWKTEAMSDDVLAGNAASCGNINSELRCNALSQRTRHLINELKQEIQAEDQRRKDYADFAESLMNCPDCGKFRNFGHVCGQAPQTNT